MIKKMFKMALCAFLLVSLLGAIPVDIQVEKPIAAPVVVYVQEFNERSALQFAADMADAHSTGQSVIPIVIDSYGGSVYSLLTMVDIIKAAKVPVATIVVGKAMSAGAVLMSCGTEGLRFAGPNATIMIHEVSGMTMGKNQDIKITAAQIDKLNKKLFHIMAENSGHKRGYYLDIIHTKGHANWYMDAEEAKKHNLINQIGIPTFTVKILVKHILKINEQK